MFGCLIPASPTLTPSISESDVNLCRLQVAYPDTAAILLMTESSVTDLNTRLMDKVTAAWFRPSVVVTGCDAYAEVCT